MVLFKQWENCTDVLDYNSWVDLGGSCGQSFGLWSPSLFSLTVPKLTEIPGAEAMDCKRLGKMCFKTQLISVAFFNGFSF